MKIKVDAFQGFTGGLDSTTSAYLWCKNNPGKTLLLHHCSINKIAVRENRWKFELKAVQDILNSQAFLELPAKIILLHSEIKLDHKANAKINDQNLAAFAGLMEIVESDYEVDTIIQTVSKTDKETLEEETITGTRIKKLREIYLPEVKYINVIENYTREEMLNILPLEIVKMLHFCQGRYNKITDPDYRGERYSCGECYSCKKTIKYIQNRIDNT